MLVTMLENIFDKKIFKFKNLHLILKIFNNDEIN